MHWYERVKRLYEHFEQNKSRLAERLGVSRRTLGRWLEGEGEASEESKKKIKELYDEIFGGWRVLFSMNGRYPIKPREIECKILVKLPDSHVDNNEVFDCVRDMCLIYYEKKGYTDFVYAEETDLYFGMQKINREQVLDGEAMVEMYDFKRCLCPFSDRVDLGDEWWKNLEEAKRRFIDEVADYIGARGRGASNFSQCIVSDYVSEREKHAGD